jgi:hypothetical protein
MYTLSFANQQNEKFVGGRLSDLRGHETAATIYSFSWECLVQISLHIPVIVWGGAFCCQITFFTSSCGEVLQHVEVHVTRNGSLDEKE